MKAASLTSTLLVVKGPPEAASLGAAIQFLHKAPRQRTPGDEPAARVSLRISAARRASLKLAASQLGCSNHALLLEAVDHFIDNVLPGLMAHSPAAAQPRASGEPCAVLDFARAQQDLVQ